MSIPQTRSTHQVTPPSSLVDTPLTPPPTDKKPFAQARRVIALFKEIQARKNTRQDPWVEIPLARGDYDEIKRLLSHDEALSGFVKDKLRYDHDRENRRLVVRMPTGVHELFIEGVEDAIRSQLKAIRNGPGAAASFARKVRAARSTEIFFPAAHVLSNAKSKYEPDASFWHDDAQYPGVIIEVAYSQKRKRLDRLAEDYILDSDASVQVVVGLNIEYGSKESCKATLSIWRPQLLHTADGDELQVVKEVADEMFRDAQREPTNHSGIRLQLSDFACEELTKDQIDWDKHEITVSTQELCEYLAAAEEKIKRQESLVGHTILPGIRKRKRRETPPEEITSGDEARYVEQEERATKRIAENDPDYENT